MELPPGGGGLDQPVQEQAQVPDQVEGGGLGVHSFGPFVRNHFLFHYVISGRGCLHSNGPDGSTRYYDLEANQGFLICPAQVPDQVEGGGLGVVGDVKHGVPHRLPLGDGLTPGTAACRRTPAATR